MDQLSTLQLIVVAACLLLVVFVLFRVLLGDKPRVAPGDPLQNPDSQSLERAKKAAIRHARIVGLKQKGRQQARAASDDRRQHRRNDDLAGSYDTALHRPGSLFMAASEGSSSGSSSSGSSGSSDSGGGGSCGGGGGGD